MSSGCVGEHVVLVLNALAELREATGEPIFRDVLAALVKFLDDLDDATLDHWGLQRGDDGEPSDASEVQPTPDESTQSTDSTQQAQPTDQIARPSTD